MGKEPGDISINVLVEAKKEYTDQLINFLYPELYLGIQTIWENARADYDYYNDHREKEEERGLVTEEGSSDNVIIHKKNVLKDFQEKLKLIPKWSEEVITNEYERIIDNTKCDWYDKLITAVFVSHVKVLSSVRMEGRTDNIQIKIPSSKNFIHKCYIECARKFHENPFLMENREDKISYIDIQRNLRDSYLVVQDCINSTIRKLLPTQQILQQYFNQEDERSDKYYGSDENKDRSGYESDNRSYISDKSISDEYLERKKDKIKNLVKQELENYLNDENEKLENGKDTESSKQEKLYESDYKSDVNRSPRKPDLDIVSNRYNSDYEEEKPYRRLDEDYYINDPERPPEIKNVEVPVTGRMKTQLGVSGDKPVIEEERKYDDRYEDRDRDRYEDRRSSGSRDSHSSIEEDGKPPMNPLIDGTESSYNRNSYSGFYSDSD